MELQAGIDKGQRDIIRGGVFVCVLSIFFIQKYVVLSYGQRCYRTINRKHFVIRDCVEIKKGRETRVSKKESGTGSGKRKWYRIV